LVLSKTCERLGEALTVPEARTAANNILADWLKVTGGWDAILLLDKRGVCVASAPAGLVGKDMSGEKSFDDAVKGRLKVSDAYKSDILASFEPKPSGWAASIAGWTVTIAAPIETGNGE
jgi:hypothetical protein